MSARRRVLAIERAHRDRLRALARRSYPEEACALLLGRRRRSRAVVASVAAAVNRAVEPRERFEVEPRFTLRVSREAAASGHEIVGIFHSHPDREAVPSALDLESPWSDVSHVIVAVAGDAIVGERCWHIADGRASEERVVIGTRGRST